MRCEFLIDDGMNPKGQRMIRAMIEAAPAVGVTPVIHRRDGYKGECELLMIYGVGHPINSRDAKRHTDSGRHSIGWDLGYFGRAAKHYPMRLTIDAPHPQHLIRPMPPERFDSSGTRMRQDCNPAGHIVLAGQGRKSRHQYDYDGTEWEVGKLRQIRAAYPGRKVIYRPKPGAVEAIGCPSDAHSPIDKVIHGASLVVVRHSNVAVDACIAGIPVVCEDGAAAALYGADICNPRNPTIQERLEFMRSLAWFQWSANEALQAWRFILPLCA